MGAWSGGSSIVMVQTSIMLVFIVMNDAYGLCLPAVMERGFTDRSCHDLAIMIP